MPNIKLIIEYDGSGFCGWQKQPNVRTIQEELQKAIELVLRTEVGTLTASGRTDSGVHARAQVVNFSVAEVPDLDRLIRSVSSLMKGEVGILSAEAVADEFHACRDVVSKQYTYSIMHRHAPPTIDKGRVWHITSPLDLDVMAANAALLVGTHDFTSLRSATCCAATPIKEILESELRREGDMIYYRVVGKGFLKQMVRNIVGTLVEMGKGALPIAGMRELLELKDRTRAGMTAPAHGLCLDWVRYS